MSDELAEVRRIVTDTHASLKLHDQKVDGKVSELLATQERMAAAMERISDATIAIKSLTEQLQKRNGASGISFALNRQTIPLLLLILFLISGTAGGAGRIVELVLAGLKP